MRPVIFLLIFAFLFQSCDKDQDCECTKETTEYTIIDGEKYFSHWWVEKVGCIGELGSWDEYDEDGTYFKFECK